MRFKLPVNLRVSDWVPILCALAIAGAAAYSLIAPAPKTPELDALINTKAALSGVIVADPDIRETSAHLTLEVSKVAPAQSSKSLSSSSTAIIYDSGRKTRVLVFTDRFTDVAYGDEVVVEGKLKKPEAFETDSDRTFDYPHYLLAHGITHQVSFPHITVLSHDNGNPVVASLISLKHFLLSGMQKALPEPESALLAGLLLGEKQSLGEKVTESFRNAGVVHIIVLSGYNVALVINAVLFIAQSFLPRVAALSTAGVAIVAFVIMTGASETTIRASIMALIVLLARFLHRPTDGIRILLIAAAGMALFNPYLVLFDLSYQLSILATLGLILFSDKIAKRIPAIPETLGLREIVSTTIATQITVLPLLILSVGQVSIVSLISNVLVLPAVPLAMLVGFISALLAPFLFILSLPFVAVSYAVLHYIIGVSVALGDIPLASVPVPQEYIGPVLLVVFALYASVFYVLSAQRKTPR
jgi:competence protein ComEC